MKNLKIRQYQNTDKDSVWMIHEQGLLQMNCFVDDPQLDNDLNSIKETYIDNNGEFLLALIENEVVAMSGLKKKII